jgi:hypothetical protein
MADPASERTSTEGVRKTDFTTSTKYDPPSITTLTSVQAGSMAGRGTSRLRGTARPFVPYGRGRLIGVNRDASPVGLQPIVEPGPPAPADATSDPAGDPTIDTAAEADDETPPGGTTPLYTGGGTPSSPSPDSSPPATTRSPDTANPSGNAASTDEAVVPSVATAAQSGATLSADLPLAESNSSLALAAVAPPAAQATTAQPELRFPQQILRRAAAAPTTTAFPPVVAPVPAPVNVAHSVDLNPLLAGIEKIFKTPIATVAHAITPSKKYRLSLRDILELLRAHKTGGFCLRDVDASNLYLGSVAFPVGSLFVDVDFSGTSFASATLQCATFENVDCTNATFHSANMTLIAGSHDPQTPARGPTFKKCALIRASFTDARIKGAINDSSTDADFTGASDYP